MTEYPNLQRIRKELSLLQKLYNLYNSVIDNVNGYYDILWQEIDIEKINNELLEYQNRYIDFCFFPFLFSYCPKFGNHFNTYNIVPLRNSIRGTSLMLKVQLMIVIYSYVMYRYFSVINLLQCGSPFSLTCW